MAEILKERSELDPQFQWDLTPMYESDAAWEAALESLDADIESLSAFAGSRPFLEVAGWKAAGGDRNGRTVVVYNQT